MEPDTNFLYTNDDCRITFDSLVRDYYSPLTYFAMRLVGNGHIAEDIVQDAFVNLLERRERINDSMHARNLLYLTVHSYSVNYLKGASRKKRSHAPFDPVGDDLSAEYIRAETNRLLYEAVDNLPARLRDVMQLTLSGFKQETIADRTGISLATVKARKAEGIKILHKLLDPDIVPDMI